MSTSIKIRLAYFGTFIAFFSIVACYKIPLSTDDYNWALMLKYGDILHIFDDYFYRLPVWRIIFSQVYPLLLNHSFIGKFLVWGVGIIGLYFPIRWFFNKYNLNPVFLPIITLLTFFAPNQFEINFWLFCTPYCFGFLFSGIGFYASRKGHKVTGSILYLMSFLTLESFIAFVVLLESSVYFEILISRTAIKKLVYSLSPVFLAYFAIRLMLHFINPYSYGIETYFKLPQLRGLIIQCFLIDFYKLNNILSFVQLMLYGYLFFNFFKKTGKLTILLNWTKRLSILFVILIVTSSYYYFLEYSARRALAGQICFCWGLYLLLCASCLSKTKMSSLSKIFIALLLISMQFINQAIIYRTKQFNYNLINKKVTFVREQLSKSEQNITIDLNKTISDFKRDWIFANTQDAELMFKLYLSPEEFNRITFIK